MENSLKLNNGVEIPAVGFGTWQIWPNSIAKNAVVDALEVGYRLIDTARIYGNEKGVGQAIQKSGISREDIFITTKLWNRNQGYKEVLKAFKGSLKRLQLAYIDLYLIHWPVTDKRLDSWHALEEIYQSGRAKAIGVSNFTVRHLEELMVNCKVVPAVNQVELHPFIYEEQKQLLTYCRENRIVVEAYSPLARAQRMNDPIISQIAQRYHKSNAQILLRWCVEHGTIPIPKSSNPQRIKENMDIFDFNLDDENMEALNNLSDGGRTCWNPESMP